MRAASLVITGFFMGRIATDSLTSTRTPGRSRPRGDARHIGSGPALRRGLPAAPGSSSAAEAAAGQ
jgi:hypothetical protein